jgi:kumamolisin
MKISLLAIVGLVTVPFLAYAAPQLPVIIPDSSGRVTEGPPGVHAHTRLRILVTTDATRETVSQINTPATLRSAYALPSTGGTGAIALVDAYHDPTSLKDFNTFAAMYGLPKETSTTATASSNKTFQVVYATGRVPQSGGSYISSWNLEEALDIEWAHAIAPGAKIYLVEAASDSMNDLLNAVQVASGLSGVHQVSMSWGSDETPSESYYDRYFSTPSVTYFAAGGDAADELEYPSSSPNVISVGGTTLQRNNAGVLTGEIGWSDTGCGISLFEPRPSFQNVIASDVGSYRGANDVAFNADPNTGVQVYGEAGWFVVGGTSAATPSWAGVVNLASVANKAATSSQAEASRLYGNLGDSATFRDITVGQAHDVRCSVGWDQLTGVGSPLGLKGK